MRKDSDESHVLDLCDAVLGRIALRQHRFAFLTGYRGHPPPVDAYYPDHRLVVEYRERQHSEGVERVPKRLIQCASRVVPRSDFILHDEHDAAPKNYAVRSGAHSWDHELEEEVSAG